MPWPTLSLHFPFAAFCQRGALEERGGEGLWLWRSARSCSDHTAARHTCAETSSGILPSYAPTPCSLSASLLLSPGPGDQLAAAPPDMDSANLRLVHRLTSRFPAPHACSPTRASPSVPPRDQSCSSSPAPALVRATQHSEFLYNHTFSRDFWIPALGIGPSYVCLP